MKKLFVAVFYMFYVTSLMANNVQINNIQFIPDNLGLGYAHIQFDIAWENSWRDAENRDAVWVFVKYNDGSGWQHAELNFVDGVTDGHTAAAGSTINTPNDGKGVFVYKSSEESGTSTFTDVQLRWNYQNDGITNFDGIQIKVLGIEMVYVPEGSFWLGDGETTDVQGHFEAATSGAPFQVNAEDSIVLGGGELGSLGNNNRQGMTNNGDFVPPPYNTISIDDFSDTELQILPAEFPKGFNGFYCMKYELTQNQYVEFLNMLTSEQATTRFNPDPHSVDEASVRYTITGTHPDLTTSTPHVTAMFVEYYDGAAYADWAGLRPMTELEFEKACRGPLLPVTGEYAWGTTNLNNTFQIISNLDNPNENITTGFNTTSGNAWYSFVNSIGAAVRAGIFAANPNNTGRETSGATYWGIMDMSGNCWERTVTVGRPEGRIFQGSHGDGALNSIGNATNTDCPGHSGTDGVDDIIGVGYRGAGFEFPTPVPLNMRISARRLATAFYNIRYYDDTMRFVRTSNF